MYKIDNFYKNTYSPKFMDLLKSTWDERHDKTDIFRYKIDGIEERFVDKYLLALNPNRQSKRRAPEEMTSICQPFDENKFNFTKVSPQEILFSIQDKDDVHTVIVNVSPISRYHSLLCPSVKKCLPQVVTVDSLKLAIEVMFVAQDRDLRLLFNSLCGCASVNHLHYHFFVEQNDFYVENAKWHHIKSSMHKLDDSYPMPAFCFEVQKHSIAQTSDEIYKVLEYFLKNSIAHNILLTKRPQLGGADTVKVLIWPRKSTKGAKQFATFNVAVLELSGWFPMYDREDFMNFQAEDLEKELAKWKIADFDKLCEEIKCIL